MPVNEIRLSPDTVSVCMSVYYRAWLTHTHTHLLTHSCIHSTFIVEIQVRWRRLSDTKTHTLKQISYPHPSICLLSAVSVSVSMSLPSRCPCPCSHSFPYLWFAMDFSIPDIHLSICPSENRVRERERRGRVGDSPPTMYLKENPLQD